MQRKTYWMSTHSCCTLSSYSMQVLNVSKFSPLLSGGTKRQGHTSQSSPSSACADPNSPAKANVNVAATTVADLAVVTKVLAKPRGGSCDFRIVQPVVFVFFASSFFSLTHLRGGGGFLSTRKHRCARFTRPLTLQNGVCQAMRWFEQMHVRILARAKCAAPWKEGRACVYVTKRSLLQSLFFRATVNLMDCSGMSLFFRSFETEYRPRMCVFSVVDVIKWPKEVTVPQSQPGRLRVL